MTSNNQLINKKMKTKKTTLSILLCSFIVLATGCGSKNEPAAQTLPDPVQKEIIAQIFGAGASVSGASMVSPSKTMTSQPVFKSPASAATSIPIPTSTTDGPNGGTLTISGNMDITTGTISMTMSEVFASFGIIADTKTYTLSGTILYTGNIVSTTTKMTGKYTTKGSLTVVGASYNKQMTIDLTETMSVTINSTTSTTSTSVTVTGTIAGQSINYTVTQ